VPFRVPFELLRPAGRRGPEWSTWLARLPTLVDECVQRWALRIVRPLAADHSLLLEVERADRSPAVLKLALPEPESEQEAEGLRRWDGHSAVRLLEADPARGALLLERVLPGRQLWTIDERDAMTVALALLPRLWMPLEDGHPFERVAVLAPQWAAKTLELFDATGRVFAPELAEEAARAFADLGASQPDEVLVHRDFHGGNVLSGEREPWLVIDPKPTAGEAAFDVAWLLGDRQRGVTPALAARRLDQAASELGLDRERLRRWTVARYTLGGLWSLEHAGPGALHIGVATVYAALR
jgi:streptomycin 6-kinase